jgi:rhomboid protease GluP
MPEQNNLGAIICPNCKKLISAGSEQCAYCGMKNPNLWGFAGYVRKLFGAQASLIPIITIVCVVYYVLSLLIDPSTILHPGSILDFLGPSNRSLFRLGATGTFAISVGKWWTIITAIYLHGGLLHIFFNLYWLRQLGPPLEEFFGVARTFVIFTVAGVLGYVVSNFFGIPFTIGASGSNFGLLGALIYYGRRRGGTFGAAIYREVGQWAIVLFIFGFLFPGINNYAHAGGFVGGYAAAAFLGFAEIKPENQMHLFLALGCMAVTILAFVLALLP